MSHFHHYVSDPTRTAQRVDVSRLSRVARVAGAGARMPHRPTATLTAEILFGRNIGRRHGVSEAAWSRFLAAEITPRFPHGLTVLDAAGQWRDQRRNTLVRERSKMVLLTLRDAADQGKIDAIVAAYKRRFRPAIGGGSGPPGLYFLLIPQSLGAIKAQKRDLSFIALKRHFRKLLRNIADNNTGSWGNHVVRVTTSFSALFGRGRMRARRKGKRSRWSG